MKSTIEEQVKALVAESLGLPLFEVKNESSFVDDLGADSLDSVELIMAVEEAFEIVIGDEQAEKLTTVQEVIDYVKKTLNVEQHNS